MRPGRRLSLTLALVATAFVVGAPAAANGATVEVVGPVLKVNLPGPLGATRQDNTVQVIAQPDGGVLVGIHETQGLQQHTVGPGCQEVAPSNVGGVSGEFPSGPRGAAFAVTCSLVGVRVIEGRLQASGEHRQGWLSNLNLPTNVQATSSSPPALPGDVIVTGGGGDRIDAGNGPDTINAGGAPFKGLAAFPNSGDPRLDDPAVNFVNGGGGDDTFLQQSNSTGRDFFTGGAGTDLVTYADRIGIGAPGQAGVSVSLDDLANDGDPNFDSHSTSLGEGDNVKADVENVIGTRREDVLVGNGSRNRLDGSEGRDTLTGAAGVDTLIARESSSAGSGIRDAISCGSPNPFLPNIGPGPRGSGVFTPIVGDELEADLADVPPVDCENVTQLAVDEPAAVRVAKSARLASGSRLRVRLTCPRAAMRTCKGTLRLAGKRPGSRVSKFSIARRRGRVVNLRLSASVAAALSRPRRVARIVASEKGLKGDVNTSAFVRVRR